MWHGHPREPLVASKDADAIFGPQFWTTGHQNFPSTLANQPSPRPQSNLFPPYASSHEQNANQLTTSSQSIVPWTPFQSNETASASTQLDSVNFIPDMKNLPVLPWLQKREAAEDVPLPPPPLSLLGASEQYDTTPLWPQKEGHINFTSGGGKGPVESSKELVLHGKDFTYQDDDILYLPKEQDSKIGSHADLDHWVVVFGFGVDTMDDVLADVKRSGPISDIVNGPNTANWMLICFRSPYDAQSALSRNGVGLRENLMYGVKRVDHFPLLMRELPFHTEKTDRNVFEQKGSRQVQSNDNPFIISQNVVRQEQNQSSKVSWLYESYKGLAGYLSGR